MRNIQLSTKLSHQLHMARIAKAQLYNSLHSSPFPKRPKLPLSHPLFAMINCEALWHIHPIKGPLYTEDHYHEKFLSAWLSAPTLQLHYSTHATHTGYVYSQNIHLWIQHSVHVNYCVKNKSKVHELNLPIQSW